MLRACSTGQCDGEKSRQPGGCNYLLILLRKVEDLVVVHCPAAAPRLRREEARRRPAAQQGMSYVSWC